MDHGAVDENAPETEEVKKRRRWPLVVVGAVVIAGVALTIAAGNGFGFSSAPSAAAGESASTAEVTKQTLTATTEKAGTLGYATEQTYSGVGGTVTWLPQDGAAIVRGAVIAKVDQKPTVLLYGSIPMYRSLSSGDTGDDVRQLEENLAALGYTGFDVDNTFNWSTVAAVKAWQSDLGLEKTGVVDQSLVFFAADAAQVSSLPGKVGGSAGGPLVTLAGMSRTASVNLDKSESTYAVVGAAVTITAPGGKAVSGKISSVATKITDVSSPGGGDPQKTTSISVTASPDDPASLAVTGVSTVKVDFTAATAKDVLTVPVNALLALAEGGYAVELDGPKDAKSGSQTSALIAVKTGLFADGRVEVSGTGLTAGQKVIVPSS